jgi:inner membrane protein
VVGIGAGIAFAGSSNPRRFLALSVVCATLPDVDMLAFAAGVPYDNLFGHRGITHSVLFAILAGLSVVRIFFKEIRPLTSSWYFYFLYFSTVVLAHGMLDAFTNGGEGAAFLAPFSNERFFFEFTPIEVSPVNMLLFFDGRGWSILANEMVWIWAPLFTAVFLIRLLRAAMSRRHAPASLEKIVPGRKTSLEN